MVPYNDAARTIPSSSSTTVPKLFCAILLLFNLQVRVINALSDELPPSSPHDGDSNKDNNNQMQGQMDAMTKRDWNKNLHLWGKRGWNNIHGGWGLKRSSNDADLDTIVEKRAWQNLQGGWGKRFDDEYDSVRDLSQWLNNNAAEIMEQQSHYDDDTDDGINTENQLMTMDNDNGMMDNKNDDEKRNWGQFHGGWGKRNKWDKFRGSWGKRDPAWSNLKGVWGKRFSNKLLY